ncbi:hypothetical protein MRX96_044235 [Rhipicephalus microplus]
MGDIWSRPMVASLASSPLHCSQVSPHSSGGAMLDGLLPPSHPPPILAGPASLRLIPRDDASIRDEG